MGKMFEKYRTKNVEFEAELLESDIEITIPIRGSSKPYKTHVNAGNYLIKTPDGRIYPASKSIFEYLFTKGVINENFEK